jgi:hypothetical protein
MQFVLLIYQGTTPLPDTDAWSALTQDEQRAIYADYAALNHTPGLTAGLPLGLPTDATTVRVDNGTTVAADGPYVDDGQHVEKKGAVGGYFVLEAEDLDAAIEVAARVPAARHGGAIEVRPVGTYW